MSKVILQTVLYQLNVQYETISIILKYFHSNLKCVTFPKMDVCQHNYQAISFVFCLYSITCTSHSFSRIFTERSTDKYWIYIYSSISLFIIYLSAIETTEIQQWLHTVTAGKWLTCLLENVLIDVFGGEMWIKRFTVTKLSAACESYRQPLWWGQTILLSFVDLTRSWMTTVFSTRTGAVMHVFSFPERAIQHIQHFNRKFFWRIMTSACSWGPLMPSISQTERRAQRTL